MSKNYGYGAINPMIPYNINSPTQEVVVEPLQRFECASNSGGKFWEVSIVEGTHYNKSAYNLKVTYGKLGTAGKTSLHRFSYPKPARTAMARKINEKINKGYFEVKNPSTGQYASFGVTNAVSVLDMKKLVTGAAKSLKQVLPVGAEVIVTVIAGPDVIQESFK